jgi:hypothetical protein
MSQIIKSVCYFGLNNDHLNLFKNFVRHHTFIEPRFGKLHKVLFAYIQYIYKYRMTVINIATKLEETT